MKQSKNTISDWLDKYGDPKIDKQVEKELEEIIIKHQREMKTPMQEHIEWMKEKLRILVEYKDLSAGAEVDECIQHAEAMLEKEKEALSIAFHTDRPSLSMYENGSGFEEWHKETFNTK